MGESSQRAVLPRPAAALAVVLALFGFLLSAIALQFARDDLDWARATLSLYLHGPHGVLLRVAYCVLAAAIAALGVMLYRQARGRARRGVPAGLFVVAGAGLAAVAIGDSWLPQHAPLLAPLLHGLAAQTAFLSVTAAMLLQAWCFGHDPAWQRLHRLAWWWAWLAFAGLWLHVLWRDSPRGLGQKLVIVTVVAWLLMVALASWRRSRKETPETSTCGHNDGYIHHRESAMIQRFDTGPRMSEMTIHHGVAYLAGQVPEDTSADIVGQTEQVLQAIDDLLRLAPTDKNNILRAEIFLADMADFPGMNEAWDKWVPQGATPARATVQAKLANPAWKIEIVITAAVP